MSTNLTPEQAFGNAIGPWTTEHSKVQHVLLSAAKARVKAASGDGGNDHDAQGDYQNIAEWVSGNRQGQTDEQLQAPVDRVVNWLLEDHLAGLVVEASTGD